MSVQLRTRPGLIDHCLRAMRIAAVASAVALAGCSASITRFDNPSFALGEGSGSAGARAAGAPSPEAPQRPVAGQPSAYQGAPARGGAAVEMATLPPIEEKRAPVAASAQPARAMAVTRQAPPPSSAVVPVASVARGELIEVQPGDTLYAIAKRHKVLISDLMAVNDLRNPNIKPGQRLYLPGSEGRATPKVKPERTALLKPQVADDTAVAAPSVAAVDGANTYVVKPGDSLYAIAARHKIKVLDLQRANGINDAGKVKPGTVLKLPDGQAPPAAVAGHGQDTIRPDERIVRVAVPGASAGNGVKVLNSGDGASGSSAAPPTATPPGAARSARLRWPARGRVVQGFGPRSDGSHSDGVDIAVPAGTDVLAAEDGVISYAGNEVKVYGNLVLVRHDNGWVTAYANNEKLLVQRGDRVRRGQPIAKAGAGGSADQPHVHFEVRVGSKPVDPVAYLEKL